MDASASVTLLDGLNDPQQQAVTHVEGPMLVLAGPGSGKTRVITRRCAFLVREVGIPPWNVLAVTFTNKAAAEMRHRVGELVTERQARALTLTTFHSLCARLLRQYADRIGLLPGYSIYDSSDQQRAVKQALSDLEINSKNFPASGLLASISDAKQRLQSPEDYAKLAGDFYSRTVSKVYQRYHDILTRNHALDFDDLLVRCVGMFREHPEILEQLRERYQYVMIDEYQDTNHAQFMIAHGLSAGHQNICATGDPDQSIYGWRGADISNILDFESHYPNARTVRLEENYRSTPTILSAADALIQHNSARKAKTLFTRRQGGDPVQVLTCYDERHEARELAERLRKLHDEQDLAWGQMAVFYRINALSRVVEESLRDSAIPYQIARGTAFYDRAEIKDSLAYLRAIVNPADEVSLLRVINTPARGIGNKTIKAMQAYAMAYNTPMDAVIAQPIQVEALNARAESAVLRFSNLIDGWRSVLGLSPTRSGREESAQTESMFRTEPTLRQFVEQVLRESGLEESVRNDKSDPDQERLANLGELVTSVQQFEEQYVYEIMAEADADADEPTLLEKLFGLLERVSLVSDVDSVDPDQGAVTLMTLHTAKGLEFPSVTMIGVEDGLLPHERGLKSDDELEEERRLCFVGMTRAMQYLTMSHARYRTVFGQTMPTIPSRFLSELPRDVLEIQDISDDALDSEASAASRWQQSTAAGKQATEYPPGTLVRHPQFGLGRVLDVSPIGSHTRARVEFNTAGVKTLILQYARLEKVDL